MRKVIFICLLVAFAGISNIVFGESLDAMTDKFYGGLTPIIESNMSNPDKCFSEVNRYYANNQPLIEKMRKETSKAMEQIAPMMEKYMDAVGDAMSGKEINTDELQNYAKDVAGQSNKTSAVSSVMKRYTNVLERFIGKYPQVGAKIAMKALEIMPAMDNSLFNSKQWQQK
jgi:hypothetical protein